MHWSDIQGINPVSCARDILGKIGTSRLPIISKDIAETLGIVFQETDLGRRVDACLRREGNKAMIVVNSTICYEGRKNFSGAHEVGHCVLPGHGTGDFHCSSNDLQTYSAAGKKGEREANEFAAELLLPRDLAVHYIGRNRFCFNAIEEFADMAKVSLTAAALRWVKLADEPCAIVLSKNAQIEWAFKSRHFKSSIKNGRLHPNTYAVDYFTEPNKASPNEEDVLPQAWLTDPGELRNNRLVEHSKSFAELGTVLTLLRVVSDHEVDYDYDDD